MNVELTPMKAFLLLQICKLCLGVVYRQAVMQPFIIGGVEVPITMYPYVARLMVYEDGEYFLQCGASIISDRVLVSAAHCIMDVEEPMQHALPAYMYKIIVGAQTISYDDGQLYDVCQMLAHPKFNSVHPTQNYYYDIALFLLVQRMTFGPKVQTIPIANDFKWMSEKYRFTVAGFGVVKVSPEPVEAATKLKATKMNYVRRDVCNRSQTDSEGTTMYVPDHMFCMIGRTWTSDCSGDSGTGISWRGYLVGVVATGREYGCGSAVVPSMYTNVVYFRNWVLDNMRRLQRLPQSQCERPEKT